MAKRRLVSLLPSFQQTLDLKSFFGASVDQVFQPGTSEPISGYIGRHPSVIDPQDFYVGEPSTSRAAYQLESGMVSYDGNGLTDVLSYPDFIGYLQTNGAIVTDQQRLTETDTFNWAPPINIDMLINYHEYYWFGDSDGAADLPILVLTIPVTIASGDGTTVTFALPPSILAVAPEAETPIVYVNNLPVDFIISGDEVILDAPPAADAIVLITRITDFAASIANQTSLITVSDINSHGVVTLSSGMRIKIIDALYVIGSWAARPWAYLPPFVDDVVGNEDRWDFGDNGIYMVDGVGLSLRLTADSSLIRDIEAQYVTIDRSSRDHNQWSLHNLWVHKDSFAWAQATFATPLSARKAVRPIIEYIRDLVLWQMDAQLATNASRGTNVLALMQTLPPLVGSLVIGSNIAPNTIITSVIGATITLSQHILDDLVAGTAIAVRQVWVESQIGASSTVTDPRFMLYDLNNVALNDIGTTSVPGRYPGSNFVGSTIFDYTVGSTPPDRVLHRALAFDQNGYFVFDNKTVTERYTYANGPIIGLYSYAVNDYIGERSNGWAASLIIRSLWHAAATTTAQGITNGFYDVPRNLQANPLSDDVSTISRSTWNDHFSSIIANQPELVGQPIGINNFRDTTRDLTVGTFILQHRAPLLKAMLLAANAAYDLPQAIRYASNEYNRFRNKFARKLVDLYDRGVLSEGDPINLWLITTLKAITRDKNSQFPFSLNTIAGDQYFIPPTPTCLGIQPAAVPSILSDTTYSNPGLILGHDGSLTPMFGDWRDPIMLALEQAIYANLPSFVWYPAGAQDYQIEARPAFDVQQWMDGRYFTPFNGYSRDEITRLLTPWFEIWTQQNHFDYRTNNGFDANNPFTWNFRDVLDYAGNPLPGNWRAIYRWYYGTDVPHLRPWEMLGFVSEPSWWQSAYGAAPYTRDNTALWTDLETGTIAGGPRAGTDDDYARDDLSDLIPVDHAGNLLDPIAIGIVIGTVTAATAARAWMVGDHGPVENLWRISPAYRFTLALISFLMKPARFVEQCWNQLTIGFIGSQWVDQTTLDRPLNVDQYVHGETHNGITLQIIGISQWIADFLLTTGHSSDVFGATIRGLDVRLIHQMAGYTSSSDLTVVADNFGLVPAEDTTVVLYTSPSTRTEAYSGVILEWTGQAWRAIGYDARNAYFTIIPPDINGPKGLISIATATEPSIVKWRANTYYPSGILAENLNTVWQCLRSHTSGPQFEQIYWQSRPDLNTAMIRAPRVVTYLRGNKTIQYVPYGTEFNSYQAISDFLLGWQRWLESRGWIFDDIDPQTGELRNWSLSVKEFLVWAQVQWAPGNFIALSPGQQQLRFTAATGTILNVEDDTSGFFGLVNRSGQAINQRDALINRLDGDITIHAMNADIFAARLDLVDIEHVLVFSNTTLFDDIIYLPLYGVRQLRLRLICKRSQDWAGRLDAPGFIIAGNDLKSDFEKAAEDVRLMYDIETPDRQDLRDYARHIIGFQRRDYLQNLLLSDIEQFEFYQAMIQQKGAPGVFSKLTRSNRASNNSNLQFLEEWAIRIDEFGAPIDPFMIFQLGQTDTRGDPQIVRLRPTAMAPLDWIVLAAMDQRWIDRPSNPAGFFPMRATGVALPSAGPVRLTDATYTIFHIADVPTLYLPALQANQVPFATGSSTWVYERADGTYTVLRSFETGVSPNTILKVITNTEDLTISSATARLVFNHPLTLTSADIGHYLVVDGLSLADPEFQGLVTMIAINLVANSVDINIAGTVGHDFSATPSDGPFVRVLREVRFATPAALTASGYRFAAGDLVWIDANPTTWTVLMLVDTTWITVRSQPLRTDPSKIAETVIYSAGTKLIDQQMLIDEPVVDDVVVIDPLAGIIAGIADREITFKLDSDPARYNAGTGFATNPWGVNEVSHVWWNLSTVKFLDPCTDTLGVTDARDITELLYRCANWSHIAPGTSVDIYEWIESTVNPTLYTGPGTVYNSDNPAWVERRVYDVRLGSDTTVFYFWVTGLTVTPSVAFRRADVSTIALAITNPAALALAWMAPIDQDALIVSGVGQFLDDATTAMKVRLTINPENAGRHDQWQLVRPTDATSLPSWRVWQAMRDSLAGFDTMLHTIPNPTLSATRAIGIRQAQGMFVIDGATGPRTGLLAARQSFIGIINKIFAREAILHNRTTTMLYRSDSINPNLAWTQLDSSYVVEPPPNNEWDIQVFALDERNRLLGRADFANAITHSINLRVLLNGMANPLKQWSIWEFDAVAANALIIANPLVAVDTLLMQNADVLFTLATSYDVVVADHDGRNSLPPQPHGTRVLVTAETAGFWAIWRYLPGDFAADPYGFVLWRVQNYRTDDFITLIDWYADGYTATNPPTVIYPTVAARNAVEGTSPTSQFVKVTDDGSSDHGWIWTVFQTANDPTIPGFWETVASQHGTLSLSSNLYRATEAHGLNVWQPLSIDANIGATSVTLADTSHVRAGQFVIGPGIDHATKVTSVVGNIVNLDLPISKLLLSGSEIAVTTLALNDIINRDGSWEIYVLVDILRYSGLLLDIEINELFFSILNFVHATQDSVDWAFKTSFMTIFGYDVPLQQTPILLSDQTASLISYINEVKPYHCKIREFATQYNPDLDIATTQVIESAAFDITLLFDRYDNGEAWDTNPWQDYLWDNADDQMLHLYVHTTILAIDGMMLQVDDIRFLQDITIASSVTPLTITIGDTTYSITGIVADVVNRSTTMYGISGTLTATTTISGTVGDVVEAIIVMPNAALRTTLYYPAITTGTSLGDTSLNVSTTANLSIGQSVSGTAIAAGTQIAGLAPTVISLTIATIAAIVPGMSVMIDAGNTAIVYRYMTAEEQASLRDIGMRPVATSYMVSADALSGDTSILLADTTSIIVGQPVFGYASSSQPIVGSNIAIGTLVTGVTSDLITLSRPLVRNLALGDTISVGLPIEVSGPDLFEPTPPDYEYDASSFTTTPLDITINPPLPSRPGGFDLRAPYHAAHHPEERLPFNVDDAIHLLVTATPVAGGPPHVAREFDVSNYTTSTATLFFDLMAQSTSAVLVYRDGLRATVDDYTVDYFARTVTVNLDVGLARVATVTIQAFGFGGTSLISNVFYLNFASNPITIDPTTTADVSVVVDGTPLTSGEYNVAGDLLTLTTPPTVGADVAVVIFAGGANTATQIAVQPLSYNVGQQWTLVPYDTDTVPERAGTIVEVNGRRLTPNDAVYTVVHGLLTIIPPLTVDDIIITTIFSNAVSMGITTVTATVSGSTYTIPLPARETRALVSMNGLTLAQDRDYQITGLTSTTATLTIFDPTAGDIVATICTASVARGLRQWMVNSRVPAAIRMPPMLDASGEQLIGLPTYGDIMLHPLYQVRDEYIDVSPFMAGTLAADLLSDDTEIIIALFLRDLADALLPNLPLTIPTSTTPGSIWIGGERIEYFGYQRIEDTVTLNGLRRATRGTSIIQQQQTVMATGIGAASDYTLTGIGSVVVVVDDLPHDFVATIVGDNTVVTLAAALGAVITIVLTIGDACVAGSIVYNGDLITPIIPAPWTPGTISTGVIRNIGVAGTGRIGALRIGSGSTRIVGGVAGIGRIGLVRMTGGSALIITGVAGLERVGAMRIVSSSTFATSGVVGLGQIGTVVIEQDELPDHLSTIGQVGLVRIGSDSTRSIAGIAGNASVGPVNTTPKATLLSGLSSTGLTGVMQSSSTTLPIVGVTGASQIGVVTI